MQRAKRYNNLMLAALFTALLLANSSNALQNIPGLVVEEVIVDSPSAQAGLKVGDYLLAYDDKPLPSPASLQAVLQNTFGKKEVVLRVRRAEQILTLKVPVGRLDITLRPELPQAALTLYEEGIAARHAQKIDETISRWTMATKAAEESGANAAVAWLYSIIGEVYEQARKWKEAQDLYARALKQMEESGDAAGRSRMLVALGRCSENLNDYASAQGRYEQAVEVDKTAGNEIWVTADLMSLGNVVYARGDLIAAQGYYHRALEIRERLVPSSLEVAGSLNNLGSVARDRGDLQTAQDYYSRALEIRRRLASDSLDVASSLNNLGNIAYLLGELQAAQDYYSRALTIYERLAPDSLNVARSLNNLGVIADFRGDLKAAQDYYSRALKINERLAPGSLNVAHTLNNLGSVARDRGDLQTAQDYYSRALKINERLAPDSLNVAVSLNNIGGVAYSEGHLQTAEDYFRRALAICERLAPDSLNVAHTLNNLGSVARDRGDLQTAQDYYSRALKINERLAPGSLNVAHTLNNLGSVARDRGDLQTAQDYYSRALVIFERLASNSLNVAASLLGLGNVAHSHGDSQAAQDYYSRALKINERLAPGSLNVAHTLNNLGSVARDRGDLQTAQDYYSRALKINERLAPDSLNVAASLVGLGAIADSLGNSQAAQDYYNRAQAIFERLAPDSLDFAKSLNNLGSVARDRGDLQTAQDHYRHALAIFERLAPNSLDTAKSLNSSGYIAFRQGRYAEALQLFTRAVAIIEAQRNKIASSEARALLVAQNTYLYTGLLRAHLAVGDLAAAFATLERARARSLLEMLAERHFDFRSQAPADLLKQQERLDEKRSTAYQRLTRLNPQTDGQQINQLQAELARYNEQQRALEGRLRQASPRYAALQYPQPLDLKEAQSALDEGTLLLAYYVEEKETYLFAVTKSSIQVFTVPVGEAALSSQVRAFRSRGALRPSMTEDRAGLKANEEQGRQLYEELVMPAAGMVKQAKRILICPDGPLHMLAFAALVSESGQRVKYFIEEKPLHTTMSMTVYAETRKTVIAGKRGKEKLLAFGDPIYTRQQAEENLPGQRFNWNDLPLTRTEVQEIAKLFEGSATVRLGRDATETNIKREIKDYTIVHIASHFSFDERIGLNSSLILSQPDLLGHQATRDDNGLWQAWEIMEQGKLKADLVVLSTCETGLGQNVRGEGIIGLTRAFQYAGAKSVIVSMWQINDESTVMLMKVFYQEIRKGMNKDVALQEAMKRVRNTVRWQHPYYWASFILVGNWQ